ncbi:type II secretion system protein [Vibrio owensii]|uniref:type II secretion system protein n=1 Tax=Vibrio owensii TaxID=696485 RepID=UPI003AAC999C
MKRKSGFTLIELVVVIVILGILAVTAAPRFLNIQDDAREARLEGMKGAIASGLGIGYGKMAIAGLENYRFISNSNEDAGLTPHTPKTALPFDGCDLSSSKDCTFRYGYPDANDTSLALLVQELGGENSDWKVIRHPAEANKYELVVAVKDDPKASLTQCGIVYGPPMNSAHEGYKLEVLPCP